MPSRLVSSCDPLLSDASRPHGGQFLSTYEKPLAYREIFTRPAAVVTIPVDARDFSACSDLDPHSHFPGCSLWDDAASDLAEYGDSVQHHSSSHGHGDFKGTMGSPNKQEDPSSALGVIRAESERVAPNNGPPRAEGDTFLDLSGDVSRPSNVSNPTGAEYSHPEEMQDSLGDFLDLSPDIDSPQPQQVNHKIPSLGDVSRLLTGDENPAEGAIAGSSGGRNPKRFGGDWADPVLAEPPTSTRQVPRKVQSAGELASGRARTVALDRSTSKPGTTDDDLQRSDSYRRRFPTPVPSSRAEVIRGGYSRRRYDAGPGPVAEYGHAYSRSAVEPSDLWRGDPYHNKRVQGLRNGDIQNLKRGALVAADTNSARESQEKGPADQRNQVEVVGPASSTLHRPRASSAATSPTPPPPPSPPRHENRYHRTLGDRAYHHPDVPRTPLFSELDHDPSSWGPRRIVVQPRRPSTTRLDSDNDDRLVSSPETEKTSPSPRSENSVSPGPRPRLRAPPGDESRPSRESSATPQTHARRHGSKSSPDLPRGHSLFVGPQSASSLGIGLSTTDNGAFEAPRPAPPMPALAPARSREQNHHPPVAWRRKNSLRIRTGAAAADEGSNSERSSSPADVFRRPLRSLSLRSKTNGAAAGARAAPVADTRVVKTASPVLGFGVMSFRWQIWSKVQKSPPPPPSERSGTPALVGRLRAAGKSEPDIKTSFIETDAKQRKGLLFKRRP